MSYIDLGLCSVLTFFSIATATIVCCKHINTNKPPHYYSIAPLQASAAEAQAQAQAQAQAGQAQTIVDAPKYESYQNSPPKYEEPHI